MSNFVVPTWAATTGRSPSWSGCCARRPLRSHDLGHAGPRPPSGRVPRGVRRGGRAETPAELRRLTTVFRYADEGLLSELLDDAGLIDVQVRTVAFDHVVASPNELGDGMLGGTVRTSALLRAQPNNVQARARAAFNRQVEVYRRGDHLELPISVKLAAGRKPTAD